MNLRPLCSAAGISSSNGRIRTRLSGGVGGQERQLSPPSQLTNPACPYHLLRKYADFGMTMRGACERNLSEARSRFLIDRRSPSQTCRTSESNRRIEREFASASRRMSRGTASTGQSHFPLNRRTSFFWRRSAAEPFNGSTTTDAFTSAALLGITFSGRPNDRRLTALLFRALALCASMSRLN